MDAIEEDLSFCLIGVSTIVIGSFDCGWGLPVFICMLLLALKYIEGSLFRFPFFSGVMLKATSTTTTSLVRISGDFSFFYSVFMLPIEAVFGLPVEAVFRLPIEVGSRLPVETVSAYLVDCVFPFNSCLVTSVVTSFVWAFPVLSALLCSRFSLGVCAIVPTTVLRSAT